MVLNLGNVSKHKTELTAGGFDALESVPSLLPVVLCLGAHKPHRVLYLCPITGDRLADVFGAFIERPQLFRETFEGKELGVHFADVARVPGLLIDEVKYLAAKLFSDEDRLRLFFAHHPDLLFEPG